MCVFALPSAQEMVNGILLENNAHATVIIRDSQFIGGSGTGEEYTFVYDSDSTLTMPGLANSTKTEAPTTSTTISTSTSTLSSTINIDSHSNTDDSEDSEDSDNDSHGISGFLGDNFEMILIASVVLVCIIVPCIGINILRFMKTKHEQAKDVEREFDENLEINCLVIMKVHLQILTIVH